MEVFGRKTHFKNNNRRYLQSDFLIIGGGVIGLNIAKILATWFPNKVISLIEKEVSFG